MKYQRIVDLIKLGKQSREALATLRMNAQSKLFAGDHEATTVLQALNDAVVVDDEYFFMGFCPWGKIENRLDAKWRAEGILTFDFVEDKKQRTLFDKIVAGDRVVLKKREKIGVSMSLHGHGRVAAVDYTTGMRAMKVDWAPFSGPITVPLMGCNETVNRRTRKAVHDAMPPEFFEWLRPV